MLFPLPPSSVTEPLPLTFPLKVYVPLMWDSPKALARLRFMSTLG